MPSSGIAMSQQPRHFPPALGDSLLSRRLSTSDVCGILNKSRQTVWRMVRDGRFPPPERIAGFDSNLWREPVVQKWLEQNIEPYPHRTRT
jgi:predicted DNA-binding transcriptional regulator AlpA